MTNASLPTTGKLVGSKDNPLAEFINLIPWEATLLDPIILDDLRRVINQHTADRVIVSNKYILLLLEHLAENGYISLINVPMTTVAGTFTLIKRI